MKHSISFFSIIKYKLMFMGKGVFTMNKTIERITQTNLRYCPQCKKGKPYVNDYVNGSIRCAKCGYFHLKQYD